MPNLNKTEWIELGQNIKLINKNVSDLYIYTSIKFGKNNKSSIKLRRILDILTELKCILDDEVSKTKIFEGDEFMNVFYGYKKLKENPQ